MCMNCENACPEDVIKFTFLPEPPEHRSRAPDTERRTALAAVGAGAMFLPAARVADSLDVNYHSKVIRPPGAVEERALPRALHPLRRVHEGLPEQRAAPGVLRGGHRGAVDAHPHRAHRLLRVLVRALRAGVPDGRHPEDHREGEDRASGSRPSRSAPRSTTTAAACRGRCRRRASSARSSARRRPRPSGSRRSTRRCATASRGPTARRPRMKTVHLQRPHVDPSPLRRLRRLREGVPGAGPARRLRHERRRDAQQDERHPAREHELQPEELRSGGRTTAAMSGLRERPLPARLPARARRRAPRSGSCARPGATCPSTASCARSTRCSRSARRRSSRSR